ncbi:MAG: polyketide cyclase [Gammaproteobacteria bacterium]|nr:polyketide cyclase [Gammaproteobacteria bacterium]
MNLSGQPLCPPAARRVLVRVRCVWRAPVAKDLGEVSREGTDWMARLTREFEAGPSDVWQVLTESDRFALWLAPGTIEPAVGGSVALAFEGSGTVINSRVTAFERERCLAFSWSDAGEPERPVRLWIEPSGSGSRLEVSLGLPGNEDMAKHCAGWEAHLAMLEAVLVGAPIDFPFELFMQARQSYKALV